jgi:carbonic anhydrase
MSNYQSPIALNTAAMLIKKTPHRMSFKYDLSAIYIADNSFALEIGLTGIADIEGNQLILKQFHIHTPGEHTVNGESFDGEVHFVHQTSDGQTVVVAVLLQIGQANPVIETIISNVHNSAKSLIPIGALMPNTKILYSYIGSLSTPPFAENVLWYVVPTPVSLSKSQLDKLHDIHIGNNRPLQPLQDRPVYKLLYQ